MNAPAILLVEDNPDDEALTLRALSRSGMGERVAPSERSGSFKVSQ